MKQHLLNLSLSELAAHFDTWGEPRYRAEQVALWTLRKGAKSFEEMTDLPRTLRSRLNNEFTITSPPALDTQTAHDNSTTKVLLDLGKGEAIETVRMDYDPDSNRIEGRSTICVSTQAGCAIGCIFCATGQQGFTRNLTAAEIVAQVLYFTRERPITNVVFMGMGEPLANYDAMLRAIRWLVDEQGFNIRQRGITVSTVGLIRPIERLAKEQLQIGLTISLHAPDDELRRYLIPNAGNVTINALLETGTKYQQATKRRITYAYALLEGVNDKPEQARTLAKKLRGRPIHVNLIPYNPTAGDNLRRPKPDRVLAFLREMRIAGINTTVREERGIEIAAACGQLRTDMLDNSQTT